MTRTDVGHAEREPRGGGAGGGGDRVRGAGGSRGWFSARTRGTLRGGRVSNGVAYVDFRDLRRIIPNASSSCGSATLPAQLDRTALQFPTVRRTASSINGNTTASCEWLQRSAPR